MASRGYSLTRASKKQRVQESNQDLLTMGDPEDNMERMAKDRTLGLLIVVFLALLMAVLVAIVVYVECFYKWQFPLRIDCNLDHAVVNYTRCLQRGCKYVVTDESLPVCFFPEGYGYERLGDVSKQGDEKLSVRLRRKTAPPLFGGEFEEIFFNVSYETTTTLRLQVAPVQVDDHSVLKWPLVQNAPTSEETRMYTVSYSKTGETFGVVVTRKDNGKVLFDTRLPGTNLAEQFLQISTYVATDKVFGLGGAGLKTSLRNDLNWKMTSFFAEKSPGDESNSRSGAHPFYMVVEEDGRAHGVFLSTSTPMDVTTQPSKITFRAIGGIMDFYIFLGESPEDVVRQFTELIGRPTFPPLWALGPHLAFTGNTNIAAAVSLVEELHKLDLKMSAVYLNRGYAAGKNTTDDPELSNVRKQLGVRLYLRADPIVSLDEYPSEERNSFLLTNSDRSENTLENIAFLDFTNDKAVEFWEERCNLLQDRIGFDGLVLGLNEPSFPSQENQSLGSCPGNKWNRPPYTVGKRKNMFDNGVCGHVMQGKSRHYNLHNMYGYHHSQATWRNLQLLVAKKKQRLAILSSSTFSGSGKYAGHWFHEPECTWENLKMAVVKIVEFSMFGMPHTGGSCSCSSHLEDACLAWTQAAAFFPLFLNEVSTEKEVPSNTKVSSAFTSLLNATSPSLATRRQMMPHFYTMFRQAHVEGSPVLRPLFFEFPRDETALDVSYQFMWGPSVMVSPRVDEDPEVKAYFPPGLWYDFHNGSAVHLAGGRTMALPASENKTQVHIRGGFIVPTYKHEGKNAETVGNILSLFVAPDNESKANGALYWDDGITYYKDLKDAPHVAGAFGFEKDGNDFIMTIRMKEYNGSHYPWSPTIQEVIICGLGKVNKVALLDSGPAQEVEFSHDPKSRVLKISSMNVSVGSYKIKLVAE